MYGCFVSLNVCAPHVHLMPMEGVRFPGSGGTDGCEPPWGGWESNSAPLEEQPVCSYLLCLVSRPGGCQSLLQSAFCTMCHSLCIHGLSQLHIKTI